MQSATSTPSVGVRELRDHLSRYLERVVGGEAFLVTERGRPIARLVSVDDTTERYEALVDAGLLERPRHERRPLPTPIKAQGTVSDLVAEQRR